MPNVSRTFKSTSILNAGVLPAGHRAEAVAELRDAAAAMDAAADQK